VPLSKNKYIKLHWSKRKKYQERIANDIYYTAYKVVDMKSGTYKKATIRFDIYFKVNRKRDIQNYLGGGLIEWLDALVYLNIIDDDNSDCIGQPIVNFHIDKTNPRTEITIEGR